MLHNVAALGIGSTNKLFFFLNISPSQMSCKRFSFIPFQRFHEISCDEARWRLDNMCVILSLSMETNSSRNTQKHDVLYGWSNSFASYNTRATCERFLHSSSIKQYNYRNTKSYQKKKKKFIIINGQIPKFLPQKMVPLKSPSFKKSVNEFNYF